MYSDIVVLQLDIAVSCVFRKICSIIERRFAAALLPRPFGKNPRPHHKGFELETNCFIESDFLFVALFLNFKINAWQWKLHTFKRLWSQALKLLLGQVGCNYKAAGALALYSPNTLSIPY